MKNRETYTIYDWGQQREITIKALKKYQKEYQEQLYQSAIEDNKYRKGLSMAIVSLRAEKMPISIALDVARGQKGVEEHRLARDIAGGTAKATMEKINILKKELDIIEEEIRAIRRGT